MVGVDYELFWKLNPKSLKPFIEAFKLRQKYDDTLAWTNGLYIKLAIASSFSKNTEYPKCPLSEKKTIEPEMVVNEIKAKMFRQMKLINSKFKKEVLNE